MRDIKFRGIKIDGEGFAFGFIVRAQDDNGVYDTRIVEDTTLHQINVRETSHSIYPETFGQFTGLNDKEGAEIYEGDILERTFDCKTNISTGKKSYLNGFERIVIGYKDGSFSKSIIEQENCYYGDLPSSQRPITHLVSIYKIIGNIHTHSN